MPYCPTCKQPFSAEHTECPNDRVVLVEELDFQTIDGPTSTWVEIASVGTDDEASLMQGFLQAEGIPCQLESLRFSEAPVNLGTMGQIRVYVSAENEAEAVALLQEREKEYLSIQQEDERVITDEGPATIEEDAQTVAESEDS